MMNIKTLSSGIAAAALISAIGLAYAQTTTEPMPASQTPATLEPAPSSQVPTELGTTPAPADMSTTNSGAAPLPADDSPADSTLSEREPRADRN